jgi:conjugal transfer/entry exclusion protein
MKRCILTVALIAAFATSAGAQLVVSDPGNLAQTVLIADRTLREYETLVEQYQAIVRMAQNLGSLDRYRIPTIGITSHDPSRWLYGTPWLQGLNTGDPGGELYRQVARRLERPGTALDALPPDAQRAIQNSYATIELTDSIAEIAGHQVALVRGYSDRLQQLTQELEADILNPSSRYHEMTAVLDKVAAGELLGRRQDMATNQLLSHALEQLLARSKRMRDTEAATMNMRLLGLRDGRTVASNLIVGAADDLRAWRLP